MAIGIIGGGAGKLASYKDYDFVIHSADWAADATAGSNCYSQTVTDTTIDPNLYIDGGTDFYIIPNMEQITESGLQQFGWLSAAESVTNGVKFYSMTGKPAFDIPATIRIIM